LPRFFVETIAPTNTLLGEDADHIARSLRLKPGDLITLCDGRGTDGLYRIESLSGGSVTARLQESSPSLSEPPVPVTLYQALPKADKLEWIVQKSVELGVFGIVPFISSRCVVRTTAGDFEKKRVRLQKIALEAAKQSGRGLIPRVEPLVDYKNALSLMKASESAILFYEESRRPLRDGLASPASSIAIMVGAEGGFSQEEARMAREQGIADASLGRRILRCETAGCAALAAILYHTGGM
jgi:16S rRNA (uracil1498-N3)-methyltransferase